MSANRRRLSPAQSGEGFWDELPDSMIKEILLRLPLSSVLGFWSISKPWLSLTTSRYFLQHWGLRHAPSHQDPPLALLLQNSYTCTERDFFLCSGVPEVKLSGFSLDFLPVLRWTRFDAITVMGSCEDLLLCSDRKRFQINYFIVNPITHRWVPLPLVHRMHRDVLAGFVCERGSVTEARKGGELRYRVVRIGFLEESTTEFNVDIFSSKDGRWNEYTMTLAEGLRPPSCIRIAVACNGILYWHCDCGGVKVIALDPFNPEEKGIHVIQNPPGRSDIEPKKYALGICQGKLRMSEMQWSEDRYHEALCMNIWELEDSKEKWQLVQVVRLREILAANSSIVHPRTAVRSSWWTLAFHPSNREIIYFYLECTGMNKVICCNLKRMSLEIESGYDFNKSFGSRVDACPFLLPWRPTPVPALPKLITL